MRLAGYAIVALCAAACSGDPVPPDSPAPPDEEIFQWALPETLREISGLVLTDDQRLLAVADEFAIIYEIDFDNAKMVKAFGLGNPTLPGDFEGIAILDDKVWIMTSDGDLYAVTEGSDGERVAYNRFSTGLGRACELEGLVALEDSLGLLCKDPRDDDGLRVFRWSPVDGLLDAVQLPERRMATAIGSNRVHPSGIEVDPQTGNWLIVAARQYAVFEVTPTGDLSGVIMVLDPARHPQTEGIAKTPDGRILLADEGGSGRARLSVYKNENGDGQ